MSTDKITNVNTGELFDRIKDRLGDEQPDTEWRDEYTAIVDDIMVRIRNVFNDESTLYATDVSDWDDTEEGEAPDHCVDWYDIKSELRDAIDYAAEYAGDDFETGLAYTGEAVRIWTENMYDDDIEEAFAEFGTGAADGLTDLVFSCVSIAMQFRARRYAADIRDNVESIVDDVVDEFNEG